MMHNPMHPGDFIKQTYVNDLGLSIRKIAKGLNVAPSTLARLVKGESNVTPEMAMRLSKALHGSPELWLNMQKNFDLWQLRKMDMRSVTKIETKVA
jgi:antitoxin HigA-1